MIEITWGDLRAIEPTPDELARYAPLLADGYNHPANAPLMGHTQVISPAEVVESYVSSIAEGMRAFLFFDGDDFCGDGDLRNFRGTTAEFAFMIAAPNAQGKGLGTRFATMVHAFGFQTGLDRIYASVVPANTASLRVFAKLGYAVDESPEGRAYAEEPGDITLSLPRAAFTAPSEIQCRTR
jgi:RimJ/RimL family protein N-acetyltransferase